MSFRVLVRGADWLSVAGCSWGEEVKHQQSQAKVPMRHHVSCRIWFPQINCPRMSFGVDGRGADWLSVAGCSWGEEVKHQQSRAKVAMRHHVSCRIWFPQVDCPRMSFRVLVRGADWLSVVGCSWVRGEAPAITGQGADEAPCELQNLVPTGRLPQNVIQSTRQGCRLAECCGCSWGEEVKHQQSRAKLAMRHHVSCRIWFPQVDCPRMSFRVLVRGADWLSVADAAGVRR